MSDLPFADFEELLDPETGEIDETIVGDIDLSYVAAKALEATEQEKLWDVQKRRWNGMLAHRQIDKRAVYGDAVVNLGFSTKLDRKKLRAAIEDTHMGYEGLFELVAAAVQFATTELPPDLREMVERCRVPGDAFAKVARARKYAPEVE